MSTERTLKKLRRRSRNTARGWLAQAIKTYARTLETTERTLSREEIQAQVLAFTEQILQSLNQSPRAENSVHEILEETVELMSRELGLDEDDDTRSRLERRLRPLPSANTAPEASSFKGLTPLSQLKAIPPARSRPALEREDDGSLTETSVATLKDFHPEIVLYSPQIPPNTGTIARLCAALTCRLHLIEPLGFDVSEKSFRRAGLDYWPFVELYVHPSWDAFLQTRPFRRIVLIETGGQTSPSEFQYEPGDLLVFGAETTGIPRHILSDCKENQRGHLVTIPMFDRGVRSLNLANSVSIVAHCALAQLHAQQPGQ
jgi:tRNA (cytidine/uridine-2'-O-)-methyltransferase